MGRVTFAVKGADFGAPNIGRVTRLTEVQRANMIGEYIFGESRESSRINGANRGKPLSSSGLTTFAANYATLAYSAWFDTGLYESPNLTWIICCDADSADCFIGNYDGTNSANNTTLFLSGGVVLNSGSSAGTQSIAPQTVAAPSSDFRLFAMRLQDSANYVSAFDQYKNGTHVNDVPVTNTGKTRSVDLKKSISIGSARGDGSVFSGSIKVAAVAMWNTVLSDPDTDTAAADIRAALALRGITT